ncbi:Putative CBF1-interacting co-repressor CIR domain, pre-mRNA splicing factor [Septoria linicola]|uniref:CBF1-interacting co-repressor CIR domain, pre-mRNA splicing factor n=1 Tax=Septoria linicola TaxID=215465 RepID=A0A9Q9EG91_9PEZI|nr:putative CBF1-interacting co-repressor CIR domain, pre-mRNA splicing factor [Septoria linicola]USW50581.1 Putative CBF1-interacting co-repressor CIR domain, pre-mRNA splicing factor [Septoria linicola]
MGGDLNLKKSWHPALMTNQRRVYNEELKALEERKKTDQVLKERAEERAIQELERLQEAAGGKKRVDKVDWMYNGPGTGGPGVGGVTEEMEGYLLGKRRLDGLVKSGNDAIRKDAPEVGAIAEGKGGSARDIMSKVASDPMLAIKKQEQAAYEAMMSDPVRRKMLMKAAGKEDEDEGIEMRTMMGTGASDEDTVMTTTTKGDRTDIARIDIGGTTPGLGLVQDHLTRGEGMIVGDTTADRNHTEAATTVLRGHARRHEGQMTRTARTDDDHTPAHDVPTQGLAQSHDHAHHISDEKNVLNVMNDKAKNDAEEEAERARKLAAMQSNATDLESDRKTRLTELEEREARQREEDDRKRSERGKFISNVRRDAENVDLGRRLGGSGRRSDD